MTNHRVSAVRERLAVQLSRSSVTHLDAVEVFNGVGHQICTTQWVEYWAHQARDLQSMSVSDTLVAMERNRLAEAKQRLRHGSASSRSESHNCSRTTAGWS